MSSINKVILIGNVGTEIDFKTTQTGMQIAKFSLATSKSFKKGDNWEEKTTWHNILMFAKSAEYANAKIKKGMQLYLEGEISVSNWQDDKGEKHYKTEIITNQCKILNKRENTPQNTPQNNQQSNTGDDLPF
jgi:single-strand DNA-binding protein